MSAEPFEFVAIGFEVEFEQACALAEALHGMPLAHWRQHARDDAQALRAHEAASYILQSLIEHGFDPR
ncbi:MAG: hypothetical protein O9343_07970 [Burkholderiaceae bacterium]|jgi:hypothetical protein|nr:hypothetical protein [Burkholderiaceae bacterium]